MSLVQLPPQLLHSFCRSFRAMGRHCEMLARG